jgi:hypothetical protein
MGMSGSKPCCSKTVLVLVLMKGICWCDEMASAKVVLPVRWLPHKPIFRGTMLINEM